MPESDSILKDMGAATWSAEDGTAYEVALEGINHVVGALSRQIGEAESVGDADRVAELSEQQRSWAGRRRELSPADRAAVDALTTECADLLRALRGTT
ncbi:hypothetical protein [Streptomyces sp. NPDC001068]|uniref:hypothetical protein n=1 Tax=Streptomyces sp. NPDC001068 TaxID=3364544 RepID=UPI003696D68F